MGFLKRAMLAVRRRKARTVVLAVLFFVIANMVLAGFSIRNATDYAGEAARKRLGGTVTLRYDTEKAMEEAMSLYLPDGTGTVPGEGGMRGRLQIESLPVTEEMIAVMASNPHVIDYNATTSTQVNSNGLVPVEVGEGTAADENETSKNANNPAYPGGSTGLQMGTFSLVGVSSTALVAAFTSEDSRLAEGAHITGESQGEVVVESTLAAANGVKLGDVVEVSPVGDDEQTIQLTVVGIYEATVDTAALTYGRLNLTAMLPYNTLYTDVASALHMADLSAAAQAAAAVNGEATTPAAVGIERVTFYLDDPASVDLVETWAAAQSSIDWEQYILDGNDAAYEAMMAPVENAADQADTIMLVVLIAGVVVLALILTLWARDRMYETGVLLAIGESKAKVVMQYVSEVLIVAVMAFALSLASGELVAQKVGDRLLQQEIVAQQSSAAGLPFGAGGRIGMGGARGGLGGLSGRVTEVSPDVVDEIDVRVTPSAAGSMFGAGLLVVALSAAMPSLAVMRYKPKTILSKAN